MTHLEHIRAKIVTLPELLLQLATLRDKKVVFTNGCFDLVHQGHVDYLSKARDMGDILIIGLNSDASVKRLKGPSRPLIGHASRALLLAAFEFVDYVVFFDEDTPQQLIAAIQPDVLVKGGDYKIDNIVGHEIVQAKGGQVVTIDFLPGFSTTDIVSKISQNNKS
jgi:rfaE bifunctional protein nucleotidyltransferase chain/domain